MKKAISILLSLSIICSMFSPTHIYASDTADTVAPIFIDISIDKKEVVAGETINFVVECFDQDSGIAACRISLKSPVSGKVIYVDCISDYNYFWYGSLVTDDTFENGLWKVYNIYLTDMKYNMTSVFNSDLAHDIDDSRDLSHCDFNFSGGKFADVVAPEIISISRDKEIVSYGDKVTFTLEATDNYSGISECYMQLYSSNNNRERVDLTFIGDDKFQGTFDIDEDTDLGMWYIRAIYVKDSKDNESSLFNKKYYILSGIDLSYCDVEVVKDVVDVNVMLNHTVICLAKGQGIQLNTTYDSNEDLSNYSNVWYSSNNNVAIVDQSGYVYALNEGEATITVEFAGHKVSCKVIVVNESNCSNTMIIDNETSLENTTITKDVYIQQGCTLLTFGEVTFTGNIYVFGTLENYGLLDVKGEVHCLNYDSLSAGYYNYGYYYNYGEANIHSLIVNNHYLYNGFPSVSHVWNKEYTIDKEANTLEEGKKSIHCMICDEIKPNSVVSIPVIMKLELEEDVITQIGVRKKLSVKMNGKEYTGDKLTWKSSASAIVEVDEYGNITPLKDGETTITVTDSYGRSDKCNVYVCANEITVHVGETLKKEYYTTSYKIKDIYSVYNDVAISNAINAKIKVEDYVYYIQDVVVYGYSEGVTCIKLIDEKKCVFNDGRIKVTVKPKEVSYNAYHGEVYDFEVNSFKEENLSVDGVQKEIEFKVLSVSKEPSTAIINGVSRDTTQYTYKVRVIFKENGSYNFNIKGSSSGILQKYKVNVKDIEAKSISLNVDKAEVGINKTLSLVARVLPENTVNKTLRWSSSDESIATVDQNGKVTGIKPGKAIITVQTSNGLKATCEITVDIILPFSDVRKSKWYYNTIKEAYEAGLMSGTSETTFSPDDNMTRGMIVTVLHRIAGKPAATPQSRFPDVGNKSYCAVAVEWAASNKVVSGYANGKFGPSDNITRQDVAVILHNYAKKLGLDVTNDTDLSKFADYKSVSNYAKPAMQWAVSVGILSGSTDKVTGDIYLNPKNNATRAECAKMLLVASEVYRK